MENPGDLPVIMQLLPLPLYPSPQTVLDLLGHAFPADLPDLVANLEDHQSFILPDLEAYNVSVMLKAVVK